MNAAHSDTERTYLIAGLKVRITGGRTARAIDRLRGFDVFRTDDPRKADITIATDRRVDTHSEEAALLYSCTALELDHRLLSSQSGYIFEMRRSDGSPTVEMFYEPHTDYVVMSRCDCIVSLKFAVWVAYSFVAVNKGVVPIHASAIVHDNQAVLFLGESGTGKSTHTRLWIEHLEGSWLLNDDSPLLRQTNGRIHVCGSPWSGKTPCYRRETLPLKAVVRLAQAPENRIRQLNRLGSIGAVFPSCPPVFAYDEALAGRMLGLVDKLVEKVPVYVLECRPDKHAVQVVYRAVYL